MKTAWIAATEPTVDRLAKLTPMSPIQLIHPSLADISEGELIHTLMAIPYWRSRLIDFYGIPKNGDIKLRVPLDTAPGGSFRGDADILLRSADHPEQAVAYEVKRIKFGMSQLRNKAPSKLGEMEKAKQQANLLAKIGFWKVFLYIFTVVDSREQNRGERSYAGLSNELKSMLASAVTYQGLGHRVGFFVADLTQSTDNHPLTIDTFGGTLRRQATAETQSPELTEWVTRAFSTSGLGNER